MDDAFKIYVEQLREGHEEIIREIFDPSFMDVRESDLSFHQPVELEGEAYLADRELVLHWDVKTVALMTCSVCNDPVKVPLHVQNFYHSESLAEIKTGIYSFKDLLRETLLLEVPSFVECCEGQCPKRQEYSKYLKKPSAPLVEEEGYQPFADLDWKP